MSLKTLDKCWLETQKDLNEIIQKEIFEEKKENIKFEKLTNLYVNYVIIMRKLEDCYDRMVHPQKRNLVKQLLEGVMARIVELKHDMVAAEFCEAYNWVNILADFQLTPDDISIPIPKYFYWERLEEVNRRLSLIDDILSKFGLAEEIVRPFVNSNQEAVLLIQRMERARQGRQRTQLMHDSYSHRNREKQFYISSGRSIVTCSDPHTSAIKIQRVWKGFSTWQKIQKEREDEMKFLGMASTAAFEVYNVEDHLDEKMRQLQLLNEKDCHTTYAQLKDSVLREEGDAMKENLENEIRNWFFAYKNLAEKFPEYPSDVEGGYKSFLLTDVEKIILNEQEEEKLRIHLEKKASKTTKKPHAAQQRLKLKTASCELSAKSKPSSCLPMLTSGCDQFKSDWEEKLSNSIENPVYCVELCDESLIYKSAKTEVEQEIKKQVDLLMRQELQLLKQAFLKDKGKKGKIVKTSAKNKKKSKVGKRKRKEKDDFPDRSTESLFEELVRERIIKRYPQVRLRDYLGEDCFGPFVKDDVCPSLSPADVRRILTEYCILPLGCPTVHSKCPLVKSVMLIGTPKSGKTMLVNAICGEIGATLIDLSFTNLIGKYSTREDLRIMFNMVSKVGRAMQPTVILVEDADFMFMKSSVKIDKSDPKRIKKGLQKLVKGIGAEDLMLVLGTARRPVECDVKALASTFHKIVLLPRPDHTSRNTLWKTRIRSLGGDELSVVDFGNLVKISDGYSSGVITNSIEQVLSAHRVALQKRKPLQLQEFVVALSRAEPVYKEEEEALKTWLQKTPLAKKRVAALEPEESKKAREKLLSKKRKQMELEKRYYGGDGKGKKKSRKGKKKR